MRAARCVAGAEELSVVLMLLLLLMGPPECVALTEYAAEAQIVTYTVTYMTAESIQSSPPDHWSQYNTSLDSRENASAMEYDDNAIHSPLGFDAPFFSRDDMSWGIGSNGYLSPTPVSMCNQFCQEISFNTLYGTLQTSPHYPFGGANWPLVGLYVCDLNPPASPTSSIRFAVFTAKFSSAEPVTEVAIVDYVNVPVVGVDPAAATVTAQVEMWRNGTIIFRYKSILDSASLRNLSIPPTVALVLSATRRVVATQPTLENGIRAIRFDPVLDKCESQYATESACLAGSSGDTSGTACVWCTAISRCMESSVAPTSCPRTSIAGAEAVGQQMYTVQVEHGAALETLNSTSFRNFTTPSVVPFNTSLGFSFPFFSLNDTVRRTANVFLTSAGFISVFTPEQDCNPIWRVCPNGNYSFAILPLVSATSMPSRGMYNIAMLDERRAGAPYCTRQTGTCPPAVVFEVKRLRAYVSTNPSLREVSYQVYLDADGVVELRYGAPFGNTTNSTGGKFPFARYPYAHIGLFRRGADDPSTVSVPWEMLREGIRITFTPNARGCDDCGSGGTCSDSLATGNMSCKCHTGFSGALCDSCLPGYYGSGCAPCPPCGANGKCDDTNNGTGACLCDDGYGGSACELQCAAGQESQCQSCNLHHGYCNCGTCVCRDGWSGPACDLDPCMAQSLNGCAACAQREDLQCGYCFDFTCATVNTSRLHGTTGYSCSYTTTHALEPGLCIVMPQSRPRLDYSYFILAGSLILLLLLVIVLGAVCVLMARERNIFDAHVAEASGGIPAFRSRPREREVIQVLLITEAMRSKRKDARVLAVPLKQVPLDKLHAIQYGSSGDV